MTNNNEKKMTLKKQLVAAIAMLMVAAVALASSTYAWFAKNDFVTAQGMSVNATADSTLLITGSSDAGKYSSVGTSTSNKVEMKPSTSWDGINFGYLNTNVKVENSFSEAATWTGGSGAFQSSDLVKATAAGTYYNEATYTIKTVGEAVDVYVSDITVSKAKKSDNTELTAGALENALRISVTYGTGNTAETYVYANTGANNSTEGVGKYTTGTPGTWDLVAKDYAEKSSTNNYNITSAGVTVTVRIWYEGQDTSCKTDNADTTILTTGYGVTLKFAKVTA